MKHLLVRLWNRLTGRDRPAWDLYRRVADGAEGIGKLGCLTQEDWDYVIGRKNNKVRED